MHQGSKINKDNLKTAIFYLKSNHLFYILIIIEWIGIDINLPNLQYLEIKDIFDTTPEGVTKMADILSRLSISPDIQLVLRNIYQAHND